MRYIFLFFLCIFLCFGLINSHAQQQEGVIIPFEDAYKRIYHIKKYSNVNITIDGILDEDVWQYPDGWTEDFIMAIPVERLVPKWVTRAKLFFDDKYLYGAFYCKEDPEKMNRFISNRDDNMLGDNVAIALDTYHDFRAAIEFGINLGGNKTDLVVTDAIELNRSWNAVWEARTHINWADSSWTAEFRIPFSQMRYNYKDTIGIWGLNLRRNIRNSNELQKWSLIPRPNSGHVFSFGEMHGMLDLPKPRGVEFLPYAMGKIRKDPLILNSPYQKGNWMQSGNIGLDTKIALSDYTLDVTFNPDFGQVEVDPSVMNLTALETFYEEKRQFFLEGRHLLDFKIGNDVMFHTRRIGANPSFSPREINNINNFAESMENVRILGALKVTGTNRSGVSLGIVQSVTAPTQAMVTRNDSEDPQTVEPLTNYTAIRVRKNWKGNTYLGGMVTSVNRDLNDSLLQVNLINHAFTAGIDFTQYFLGRRYFVDTKIMMSSLRGSQEAITRLQTRPIHYYQRQSAQNYLEVNEDLTSLGGTSGLIEAGRRGNVKWFYTGAFGWSSPGFNLNDMGFIRSTDYYYSRAEVAYRNVAIWKMIRENSLRITQENHWNFGNKPIHNFIRANWTTLFVNRMQLSVVPTYGWNFIDPRLLRGGPDLQYDPYVYTTVAFNTDRGRKVMVRMDYANDQNPGKKRNSHNIKPSLTLRIGNHVQVVGEYSYTKNDNSVEYVATATDQNMDIHYIMGYIHQKTHGLTLKMQVNLTPDISVQFYGSPFTSTANFDELKLATETGSKIYKNRFHIFDETEISGPIPNPDGLEYYYVNRRESNGEVNYRFRNPNFSFNEFRSNLVVRWEYRPGSTLYFVWEHTMSNRDPHHVASWVDNLDRMFSLEASNIFMVKLNYWFSL